MIQLVRNLIDSWHIVTRAEMIEADPLYPIVLERGHIVVEQDPEMGTDTEIVTYPGSIAIINADGSCTVVNGQGIVGYHTAHSYMRVTTQ